MELIVIGENTLKIIFTQKDMELYGLDEDEFHLCATDTRRILERIIKNSPVRTGFEYIENDDRILMQLYPDKNGGCELFVTKISLEGRENYEEDDIFMPTNNEERYLLPRSGKRITESKKNTLTYSFKELDWAISASREMISRNFSGESSFYISDDGRYFLSVSGSNGEKEGVSPSSYLSEFGELENSDTAILYLIEHGKCLCKKNAIQMLAEI